MKKQEDDLKSAPRRFGNTIDTVKKYLKENDIVQDASYELGRSFRIVRNTCVEIFNDLME